MRLELKTPGDTRPRPKANMSQNATSGGSADDDVIIIDDLSSPEDEVNPDNDKDTGAGDNKQLSLEPDAKKQKMELSGVEATDQQTMPTPIVDDALLSAIPMPAEPPMPAQLPSASVVTGEVKCSPVMAQEKISPTPTLPLEQHSTPADEEKTSPASVDQRVTSSDVSYAFKRLTELPMPPAATDDECESPSGHSR